MMLLNSTLYSNYLNDKFSERFRDDAKHFNFASLGRIRSDISRDNFADILQVTFTESLS